MRQEIRRDRAFAMISCLAGKPLGKPAMVGQREGGGE